MPLHEPKICPRCAQPFECHVGDIANCQCTSITLTAEECAFIEDRYSDCLCINCLRELKNKYIFFKEKFMMQG
ncbi:MAG: cysteine-rich CWC family protein [Panacibacter sp.]